MSEKPRYENISKIGSVIKEGRLSTLFSDAAAAEKDIAALIKNISEKEREIEARAQELMRAEAEKAALAKSLEAEAEKARAEKTDGKAAELEKSAQPQPEKVSEEKAEQSARTKQPEKPEQEKSAAEQPAQENISAAVKDLAEPIKQPKKKDEPKGAGLEKEPLSAVKKEAEKISQKPDAPQSGKKPPEKVRGSYPVGERAQTPPERARGSYPVGERGTAADGQRRSYTPSADGRRSYTPSADGQRRSYTPPEGGQRRTPDSRSGYSQGERGSYNAGRGAASPKDRAAGGGFQSRDAQKPPLTARTGRKPLDSAIPAPAAAKGFAQKRKVGEKNYDDKKNTLSKRALIKESISVKDFDENRTGYRKLRVKKQKTLQQNVIKIEKAVLNTDIVPIKLLSEKIGASAVEITKILFRENIFKTINDTVDFQSAELVAAELGIELELRMEKTAEEVLTEVYEGEESKENLLPRPPVVTVMGHVDHGKTSLLDRLRKSNVTAGEAGGITQHIGAYTVSINGKKITFIDTPGHSAFTAMRARGAKVTDIAIIVVAADDGIMPQTIEAINHAKAAGVAIIVAVNKMDKQGANPDRIMQQMTEHSLVPEEWGGDIMVCPVSAKTGEGIDKLLENITLLAELKELKANPNTMARGVIIEAELDKGKGPVATVLVQNGTLKAGDSVISGTTSGRIRAMIDDKGKAVKEAGPSMAVAILGLEEVPAAGDMFHAVEKGKLIKSLAAERKRVERESMIKARGGVTLDDIFGKIAEGNIKELRIILKADVQGTVEAVRQSLEQLSGEEVRVSVIHAAAGAINESDIMLAETSKAIVVGFNVRCDAKSKAQSERSGVDVRTYRVIYELLDDIDSARKGMLEPKYREEMTGKCEVRDTFKITGVGTVAGCYVTDGKLVRGGKLRIYRDDILIVEGDVKQLKRFKDDVKEVNYGYECGVSIENFNDIKVGDIIECYIREQIKV